VPPIRNRIDMLATGIKSPLGIKVAGPDLKQIDRVAQDIERVVRDVPGVSSALAERLTGGRYIDITIDRFAAARYGMNVSDVQEIVSRAINEAGLKQREDIKTLNESVQTDLQSKGLAFNQCDTDSFRAKLRDAGFYKDWKQKFGPEAWGHLESVVGTLA